MIAPLPGTAAFTVAGAVAGTGLAASGFSAVSVPAPSVRAWRCRPGHADAQEKRDMKPNSKLAGALAALALAGGLAMASPGTAHAAGTAPGLPRAVVPAPDWNEIVFPGVLSRSNVMCLDDPGGSTQAGQFLQMWHCHGSGSDGAPQRWQFIPVATSPDGRTAYVIRNTGSHLCLAIGFPFGRNPPPSNVFQNPCPVIGASGAQVWLIGNPDSVAPAQFQLQVGFLNSGTVGPVDDCLTANDLSDVNGTGLFWGSACHTNDPRQQLTLG